MSAVRGIAVELLSNFRFPPISGRAGEPVRTGKDSQKRSSVSCLAAAMVRLGLIIRRIGFAMCSLVTLENVFNFRDAGGHRTNNGQTVKSGCLFRSGAFTAPTDGDLARLSDLEIKLLVDLRRQSEQLQSPNNLPDRGPVTLSLPIWPKANNNVERALLAGTIRELGASSPDTELDTPNAMRNFYRSFIRHHRDQWSQLLQKLCETNAQPAVLHCAGGKDRTGVAIAVVLRALGVPMDTIMQDYLLTNVAVGQWIAADHPEGLPSYFLSVMKADPSYLDAAFAEIDSEFGGFENYLVNGLHFSDTQKELLELAYLD